MPLYVDKTSGPGEMHPVSVKIMYNGMMFAFLGMVAYFLGVFSPRRWTYMDKAAAIFVAFIVLSLLWTTYVNYTMYELVLLFASIVAYRLTLLFGQEKFQRDGIIWSLFLGAVCIAALGVYDHWTPGRHLANPTHVGSLFGNKNMATHYLILVYPLSFYLFFQRRIDIRIDGVIALGWLLMSLHLIYAGTRSALVGLFFMLVLGVLVGRSTYMRDTVSENVKTLSLNKKILSTLVIIAFFVLMNYSEYGFQWFFNYGQDEVQKEVMNSSYRLEIWRGVADKILERPVLGWGFGSYEYWRFLHNEYGLQALRLHNEYLQLLYEIGLIGCAVFFVLVLSIGFGIFQILSSKKKKPSVKSLSFVLMLACIGTGAQSFFTFPYQLMIPAIVLAVYMALISSIVEGNSGMPPINRVAGKEHLIALLAIICFLVNFQWFRDSGDVDDLLYRKNANDEFAYGRKKWIDDVFHEVLTPKLPTINQQHSVIRMKRILEQNPHNIFAMRTLVLSYRILGDSNKAEQTYRKILEQVLSTATYQRFAVPYVLFLLKEGRQDEAKKIYQQLADVSEEKLASQEDFFWEDSYAMGEGAMMLGAAPKAVKYLNKALDAKPSVVESKMPFASTLANAYRRSGDVVMARRWYKEALKYHPTHPQKDAIEKFLKNSQAHN